MTTEALGDQIAALAADIEAAMCRWLELVAEFDRREGWFLEGCTSCAAWVAWRCGVGPTAAREHVRVARRLHELPSVRAAFSRGELSYSKVRAITRVEDVEHEDELVELARNATAAQLERIVRSYRSAVLAESDAARVLEQRFLALEWQDDGSLRVRGRLPADQGALLMKAVELVAEQLRADACEEDAIPESASAEAPVPARARHADALAVLADQALAAQQHGRTGGDRVQLVVRVDADALAGDADDAAGCCELDGGPPLARATTRRLACDASVVRMVERDGEPLSVGRKTRSIPPALRRALRARDGGCRFPGCAHDRFVDAHHIEHWADGGATELKNLVHLCTHHHRLLHEGGFTVRAEAHGGFSFRTPDGRLLRDVPRAPRRARDRDACATPRRASAETRIQLRRDRLDLDLATGAMLWIAPPDGA
ncbi:HNH endonuclease [Svornostia abyssi]|uniref:HNH endonuclease n=1 Tax=Svornostia abyssi TaxID=2898438 RepID=A0ABY5PFT3_9ACTN|nr:HNH endonuclease [Parviterribacteraceae bacterium J379]